MPIQLRLLFSFVLVIFGVLTLATTSYAKRHTLLVVLTHGDDIISIAPLVAKTAAEGNTVYYAMFTGLQDPSGEEGSKGRADLECGMRALGVREKFVMRGPAGEGQSSLIAVAERLIEVIETTKPDVIITWGPDGVTGHPRHIMVGNTVTRVFQQRANLKHRPSKLYYVAYPESVFPEKRLPVGLIADVDGPFGTVSDEFVTTRVDGSRFLKATEISIACFTLTHENNQKWQKTWTERLGSTLGGKVHLRLVMPAAKRPEKSIFVGL